MAKPLQSILNWVCENFKKDASKMLIWTGVAGWTLSSLAQICGILFNKEIPKEQKSYLVPQELFDAAVNIGSFFIFTQTSKKIVSKMFSTGKWAPKSVRAFLDKNKAQFGERIGKLDFDLDKVLKQNPDFPKEAYYACKNFGTTIATIGAGVVSSNIITPILRNRAATKMQKNYIDAKTSKPNETTPNNKPTFKSNPLNYNNSYGMKI